MLIINNLINIAPKIRAAARWRLTKWGGRTEERYAVLFFVISSRIMRRKVSSHFGIFMRTRAHRLKPVPPVMMGLSSIPR